MTVGYSRSGSGRPLYDPATGEQFDVLPDSSAEECARTVERARNAFRDWSETSPQVRAEYLRWLAERMRDALQEFVELERRDAGKPVTRIGPEVEFAARSLDWFAGEALRPKGEMYPTGPGMRIYSDRLPLGVCAVIAPSNYPLLMATWKLAAALAYGNTVVVKPSPDTPCSVRLLVELAAQILPPHALSAVYGGADVGRILCELPEIASVSFTGSTSAGRDVAGRCGQHGKRVSLELGGKNPLIVFPDADLDAAVATTVEAFTGNSGQMCVAASRLIVHEGIRDDFVRRLLDSVGERSLGPTDDPSTDLGPLVTRQGLEFVRSVIASAIEHGATALFPPGCNRIEPRLPETHAEGNYITPVVLDQVDTRHSAWRVELAAPVLSVKTFRSEEEALNLAHDTDYGLSASVWTSGTDRAERFARNLRSGMVWINTWGETDEAISVGGIDASGYGRELGIHAVEHYTHNRSVWVSYRTGADRISSTHMRGASK